MPLVTVKSKFQVTIPARLRKGIDLREGDIMEATLMGDGILFRPKQVVDRDAAADRIAAAVSAETALARGRRTHRRRDHGRHHRRHRRFAPGPPQP